MSDPPSTNLLLAGELAKVLSRIGRGLRYRTRAARDAIDVTPAENDLLRLLDRRPGIRVHDAALELGVASNSVSTLVKQLTRVGLIERTSDPADGRAACLRLTPLAAEWITRVGSAREEALDRGLTTLDAADREVIDAAVPALKRLAKSLGVRGGAAQ